MTDINIRGGKRDGAGRRSTWRSGQCKAIKVPVAIADKVLEVARAIDIQEAIREAGYPVKTPEQILIEIKGLINLVDSSEPGYTVKNSKELIKSLKQIMQYGK